MPQRATTFEPTAGWRAQYSVYFTSNVLSAAAASLVSLYLASTLSPSDYGAWSAYLMALSFLSMFVGLSVHGAAGASFFRLNRPAFAEYVSSVLVVVLTTASLVGLMLMLFRDRAVAVSQTSGLWLALACAESLFRFLRLILLSVLISMQATRHYVAFQLGYSLLDLLLVVVLVAVYPHVESRLYAQLASSFYFSLLTLRSLRHLGLLTRRVKAEHLRHILKFGVLLFPSVVGTFLMTMADKYLVNVSLGHAALGVYMFSYQIAAAMALFWESFNKVFAPRLFLFLSGGEGGVALRRLQRGYFAGALLLTAIGALSAYLAAPYLVPAGFEDARHILPILLVGEGFNGLYLMYNNYFHYHNKTHFLSASSLLSGALGLLLLYGFLARYGVLFAAGTYALVCLVRLLSVRALLTLAAPRPELAEN